MSRMLSSICICCWVETFELFLYYWVETDLVLFICIFAIGLQETHGLKQIHVLFVWLKQTKYVNFLMGRIRPNVTCVQAETFCLDGWMYGIFSCLAWDQSLVGALSKGTSVSRFSNMVGYCWNHCLDVHDWSQSQLKFVLTGSMKGLVTQLPVLCAQFNTGTFSWIWHVVRCHIGYCFGKWKTN